MKKIERNFITMRGNCGSLIEQIEEGTFDISEKIVSLFNPGIK